MRAVVAILGMLLVAADPPAAGGATLTVQVEGLKGDRGKVHASLYASEEGFPTRPRRRSARRT